MSFVFVFVGNVSGGVSGFYEVPVSPARSSVTLLLSYARSIPAQGFDTVVAGANSSRVVGGYSGVPTRVLAAASGAVQVSLSWDSASDVDLHVVEPGGLELYYGRPSSSTGGALDLDSNAGCAIDGKNNENINWPVGRAPSGTYTVRVDYWSACGVSNTNYVVRVNNGSSTSTYTGSFTGVGTAGGVGSGRTITTFNYAGIAGDLPGPLDSLALDRAFVVFPHSMTKLRRSWERGHGGGSR